MKILKRPDNLIFDTDQPSVVKKREGEIIVDYLNNSHTQPLTDWGYLRQYFNYDHQIFLNFSRSYFYSIEETASSPIND